MIGVRASVRKNTAALDESEGKKPCKSIQSSHEPRIVGNKDMSHRENKGSIGEGIFLFAFAMLCLKSIFTASELFPYSKTMDTIFIALFIGGIILKLLLQTYTATIYTAMGLILSVAVLYLCAHSGNNAFLMGFLCIIAMQEVDILKVLKLSSSIKIVTITIHVIWYIITYYTNPDSIHYMYRNGVWRNYFFLGHPNFFAALFTWTCFEIIYINYDRIRGLDLTFMWLLSFIFYRFTDSNTGIIMLSLIILLIVWDKSGGRMFRKTITLLVKYGHFVCSVVFMAFVAVYTSLDGQLKALWESLDSVFTGRMLPGVYVYDTYGFTLLGRTLQFAPKVNWNGVWFDNLAYFDNYYIGHLVLFGIVLLTALSLVFFILSDKLVNKDLIIILAYIFYGIMESYVSNLAVCFSLLLVGRYIYPSRPQINCCEAGKEDIPLWKRRRLVS